jgi:hypothetical protein
LAEPVELIKGCGVKLFPAPAQQAEVCIVLIFFAPELAAVSHAEPEKLTISALFMPPGFTL